MNAALKPIVLPLETGTWQGSITGGDTWFNNPNGFRAMMNHYADIASETNVSMLVVGTELSGTVSQSANWRNVISDVRSAL